MKKITLLSLLIYSGVTYAQVGVGTILPHPSTELHISSEENNKGVLIPEIALKGIEDNTVIYKSNPTEGLIIFNTTINEALNLSKGFYYWGKIREDQNNLPIMGWNKLIANDDLLKYISENQVKIVYEETTPDSNTRKTRGFTLNLNGAELGKFNESLTKFGIESSKFYVLVKDGQPGASQNDPDEIHIKLDETDSETEIPDSKKVPGYTFTDVVITKQEFVYTDESGKTDVYELKNVLENVETLTNLRLENNYLTIVNGVEKRVPALIYLDEIGVENPIFLDRLFQFSESLTDLRLDTTKMVLVYTDEKKNINEIDINHIVKSPWYKKGQNSEIANFGDDIYTEGWVGIGYTTPSDAPNEKLRVNGSVTAVNSYYADYVFDAYYNGESNLKYDYKFNKLSVVENFIKQNNHLPGITSINNLQKTDLGYSFNLSELSIQLLEKTEELYLHTIDQEKQIQVLQQENIELKQRLESIEMLINEKLSK